jgi:hypothetical protein
VLREEFGDDVSVGVGFFHAKLSVSSEPSIQHECGSSCVPIAPLRALIDLVTVLLPSAAPAFRSESGFKISLDFFRKPRINGS